MTDTAVYLLPGMKAKIKVPDFFVGFGTREIINTSGVKETRNLVDINGAPSNGFILEDVTVGSIEAVSGEPAVTYTHKKFAPNKIIFFGRNTGETCTVSVISVPIHDHSSIVTGGPAYATYFTDDETITTTETSEEG